LLELADRLWPGAEGWFERPHFYIKVERCRRDGCPLPKRVEGSLPCGSPDASRNLLAELLAEAKQLRFEVGNDDDHDDAENDGKEDSGPIKPIELQWSDGRLTVHLDWWSDKSLKPWAGRMEVRIVLRAMLDGIDPQSGSPFNNLKVAYYSAPGKENRKKREPFYFDPRRGNKSHPLDCGFSPDTHKMEAECCPALEALSFIGLQRARPAPTGVANQSRYTVWPKLSDADPGIPPSLLGPVTCGALRFPGSTDYVFNNYFRTERRQYKTYSQATLERSKNA
jgi:CRISPR-associated protein Csb3